MVEIEIDGKKVEVPPGSMVMDAANKLGTYIPHFCYHKKLSIAANCRMCLVEIEKMPKPQASCALPVGEGMVVKTDTPTVHKALTAFAETWASSDALRDTFENWQSEFLQLLWQVVGLAYFLYVGSPSSKENDDRMEAKIDALITENPRLNEYKSQIRIDITPDGLQIQIIDDQNRPMFDSGSAVVKPYMRDILRELGAALGDIERAMMQRDRQAVHVMEWQRMEQRIVRRHAPGFRE